MKSFGDRNFQVVISKKKKNLHRSESSGDLLS
nr:MAG TPA: coat protein [Caudoviricetes sp.]